MILVFVICKNKKEAEKIGLVLLKKKLAACIVVVPKIVSAYFWPPCTGRVEKNSEALLLLKTLPQKFASTEREVKKIHSYALPFIASVKVSEVNKEYLKWLEAELK